MKAGFGRMPITPPPGTLMANFGNMDTTQTWTSVHDDLYVRAFYTVHGREQALILAYDLLFLGRDEVDALKGAVGRHLDILPRQILVNFSHTHSGPTIMHSWAFYMNQPRDEVMARVLEEATIGAALQAAANARDAVLWAGEGQTVLPVSRRRLNAQGKAEWAPDPKAKIYDRVPICLVNDTAGKPICCLFSASCHPTTTRGQIVSGEYPGAAMKRLDEHFGAVVSLFLQGCAGDTKPRVVADGEGGKRWRWGTFEEVDRAGTMLAESVLHRIEEGLAEVKPSVRSAWVDMTWPLGPTPDRRVFEDWKASDNAILKFMGRRFLGLLDRGQTLATAVPVLLQAIQLGRGLRIAALEGEAVSGLGWLIRKFYRRGVTFPLGYSNGTGMYLPVESMLPEEGYEVESFSEYGYPAPLASGFESILLRALEQLKQAGIR